MSYDRSWIKSEHLSENWIECQDANKKNLTEDFNAHFRRLREQGDFVVLSAGGNFVFDEVFLSDSHSALQELFDGGFRAWESNIDDAEEGCGFQEVSLYQKGRLVATKYSAPSSLSPRVLELINETKRALMPEDAEDKEFEND